jgi:DNA polymerase-3 subunit epsilon
VTRIHGITLDQLAGKPLFAEIADDLLAFLGDGKLVAHNAPFDFGFLNAEFSRLGQPALDGERMIDTLAMAKARFPGLPNSLDALCRRFGIDLSERSTHNALLDCKLLAEVYVELTGGRQGGLSLADAGQDNMPMTRYAAVGSRTPRQIVPTEAELLAHATFLAKIKGSIWTVA